MSSPSDQLEHELASAFARSLQACRPILTHLNADTSWLIQIPWPASALNPEGRYFFNVLIDPWFRGTQSDVASFFSTQEHLIRSSVQTIAELEQNLKEIQGFAEDVMGQRIGAGKTRRFVDVVAISHEFTDHCHQATLLELDSDVPVFATDKAAELIRSWKHFDTVITTPAFCAENPDWTTTSVDPLPDFVGISRIVTAGNALYYHSAIMVTFSGLDAAEAIIYSPHGIVADDLRHLAQAKPPIQTLALLHGLHDVGITWTKQLNLGGHNGLRAQRICKAKYWVGTHDAVKKAGGLIAPFLRRTVISVQEALEQEKKGGGLAEDSMLADMENVNFSDLKSGESLLLV